MYIVLTYDVNQKRVGKVMKICRKYLVHEQRSVSEGIITESKLSHLKKELTKVIDFSEDVVSIYMVKIPTNIPKEQIGVVTLHPHII